MSLGWLEPLRPEEQKPVEIDEHGVLIGRREGCSLQIAHNEVGRRHARLQIAGDGKLALRALSKSAPTYVNGNKMPGSQSVGLSDGDVISIPVSDTAYEYKFRNQAEQEQSKLANDVIPRTPLAETSLNANEPPGSAGCTPIPSAKRKSTTSGSMAPPPPTTSAKSQRKENVEPASASSQGKDVSGNVKSTPPTRPSLKLFGSSLKSNGGRKSVSFVNEAHELGCAATPGDEDGKNSLKPTSPSSARRRMSAGSTPGAKKMKTFLADEGQTLTPSEGKQHLSFQRFSDGDGSPESPQLVDALQSAFDAQRGEMTTGIPGVMHHRGDNSGQGIEGWLIRMPSMEGGESPSCTERANNHIPGQSWMFATPVKDSSVDFHAGFKVQPRRPKDTPQMQAADSSWQGGVSPLRANPWVPACTSLSEPLAVDNRPSSKRNKRDALARKKGRGVMRSGGKAVRQAASQAHVYKRLALRMKQRADAERKAKEDMTALLQKAEEGAETKDAVTTPLSAIKSQKHAETMVTPKAVEERGVVVHAESKGRAIVGRRVEVYWDGDDTWYEGNVVKACKTGGKHLVRYDDGDEETICVRSEERAGRLRLL